MTQSPTGANATPVYTAESNRPVMGVIPIPVYQVTTGSVEAGAAMPVHIVTDASDVQGGTPIPVYFVDNALGNRGVQGEAAIPVYIVNPTAIQQVANPTFSPVAGSYTSTQTVTISTTTAGATIRYTTDGSMPSQSHGTVYSGAITVSTYQTLKAIAYKSGAADSAVVSAKYSIAWWLAGGVSSVNCIGAYQPIGASSLANSKINVNNPGTHDAVAGVDPSWTSANGWAGDSTSKYLLTGIVPAPHWSAIVFVRNATAGTALGQAGAGGFAYLQLLPHYVTGPESVFGNGSNTVSAPMTTGAQLVAGQQGYIDALPADGVIGDWTDSDQVQIALLARNVNGAIGLFFGGNLVLAAVYNIVLSQNQINAIITAANDYMLSLSNWPDIFIIAGQSNASGRGTNSQSYSHATLQAMMFGNDYVLKNLSDPTDNVTNQVDAVSNEGPQAGGSVWPLVATSIMSNNGRPVIFVPCAMGSTSITSWQPGANHQDRATLYGSMVYRALQAQAYGTLRGVLWWQGETDAANNMTQTDYATYLASLATAIQSDLGIPLIPCKLQHCDITHITQVQQDTINAAISSKWGVGNVVTGPDLTGINTLPEDNVHLTTDAKLSSAAGLWWTAIKNAMAW